MADLSARRLSLLQSCQSSESAYSASATRQIDDRTYLVEACLLAVKLLYQLLCYSCALVVWCDGTLEDVVVEAVGYGVGDVPRTSGLNAVVIRGCSGA